MPGQPPGQRAPTHQIPHSMKRILAILLPLLFLGSAAAMAQAVVKFDKTSHDFGTFKEETPVTHVFTFTNTGDKPLVIQQAFASCGCTVAEYTKTPVQPGKTGQLKVTYNGQGKFGGHFKKSVTVRSNASNAMVRIYIEGTMIEKQK